MTQIDLDHPIHEQVDTYRDAADSVVPADVRAYYDGNQPVVVSPDLQAALDDRAMRPLIENMIARCVDTIAGRLLFSQYVCDDNDVSVALNDFAAKNHFTNLVISNTSRGLVDGNTAISLGWDSDSSRPLAFQEQWWDGDEGVYIETSESGIEQWAVKEWTALDKRKRRTVYLPDRILRFIRDGEKWSPYPDESAYEQPWVKADGTPLGVPMIHFANVGSADSKYGRSKVEPLLGLQDSLNGVLFDIVAASALAAFGVYTASGVDTKKNPLHVGPGRLWSSENDKANFDVLNGSSMEALEDSYRLIRSSISSQFPVADHVITGSNWPSGTALQRAESEMVGYVKKLGDHWAPDYVRVGHRATEMMNAFGSAGLDEDAIIRVAYEAAEQLDEGTMAEIDRERVETFALLAGLPKSLMVKTRIVDEAEAETITQEQASSMSLIADAGF